MVHRRIVLLPQDNKNSLLAPTRRTVSQEPPPSTLFKYASEARAWTRCIDANLEDDSPFVPNEDQQELLTLLKYRASDDSMLHVSWLQFTRYARTFLVQCHDRLALDAEHRRYVTVMTAVQQLQSTRLCPFLPTVAKVMAAVANAEEEEAQAEVVTVLFERSDMSLCELLEQHTDQAGAALRVQWVYPILMQLFMVLHTLASLDLAAGYRWDASSFSVKFLPPGMPQVWHYKDESTGEVLVVPFPKDRHGRHFRILCDLRYECFRVLNSSVLFHRDNEAILFGETAQFAIPDDIAPRYASLLAVFLLSLYTELYATAHVGLALAPFSQQNASTHRAHARLGLLHRLDAWTRARSAAHRARTMSPLQAAKRFMQDFHNVLKEIQDKLQQKNGREAYLDWMARLDIDSMLTVTPSVALWSMLRTSCLPVVGDESKCVSTATSQQHPILPEFSSVTSLARALPAAAPLHTDYALASLLAPLRLASDDLGEILLRGQVTMTVQMLMHRCILFGFPFQCVTSTRHRPFPLFDLENVRWTEEPQRVSYQLEDDTRQFEFLVGVKEMGDEEDTRVLFVFVTSGLAQPLALAGDGEVRRWQFKETTLQQELRAVTLFHTLWYSYYREYYNLALRDRFRELEAQMRHARGKKPTRYASVPILPPTKGQLTQVLSTLRQNLYKFCVHWATTLQPEPSTFTAANDIRKAHVEAFRWFKTFCKKMFIMLLGDADAHVAFNPILQNVAEVYQASQGFGVQTARRPKKAEGYNTATMWPNQLQVYQQRMFDAEPDDDRKAARRSSKRLRQKADYCDISSVDTASVASQRSLLRESDTESVTSRRSVRSRRNSDDGSVASRRSARSLGDNDTVSVTSRRSTRSRRNSDNNSVSSQHTVRIGAEESIVRTSSSSSSNGSRTSNSYRDDSSSSSSTDGSEFLPQQDHIKQLRTRSKANNPAVTSKPELVRRVPRTVNKSLQQVGRLVVNPGPSIVRKRFRPPIELQLEDVHVLTGYNIPTGETPYIVHDGIDTVVPELNMQQLDLSIPSLLIGTESQHYKGKLRLNVSLFPYQQRVVEFWHHCVMRDDPQYLGVLVAHDTGSGKTVTATALITAFINARKGGKKQPRVFVITELGVYLQFAHNVLSKIEGVELRDTESDGDSEDQYRGDEVTKQNVASCCSLLRGSVFVGTKVAIEFQMELVQFFEEVVMAKKAREWRDVNKEFPHSEDVRVYVARHQRLPHAHDTSCQVYFVVVEYHVLVFSEFGEYLGLRAMYDTDTYPVQWAYESLSTNKAETKEAMDIAAAYDRQRTKPRSHWMLVVDEAHKLMSSKAQQQWKAWRQVFSAMLILTATPMHNFADGLMTLLAHLGRRNARYPNKDDTALQTDLVMRWIPTQEDEDSDDGTQPIQRFFDDVWDGVTARILERYRPGPDAPLPVSFYHNLPTHLPVTDHCVLGVPYSLRQWAVLAALKSEKLCTPKSERPVTAKALQQTMRAHLGTDSDLTFLSNVDPVDTQAVVEMIEAMASGPYASDEGKRALKAFKDELSDVSTLELYGHVARELGVVASLKLRKVAESVSQFVRNGHTGVVYSRMLDLGARLFVSFLLSNDMDNAWSTGDEWETNLSRDSFSQIGPSFHTPWKLLDCRDEAAAVTALRQLAMTSRSVQSDGTGSENEGQDRFVVVLLDGAVTADVRKHIVDLFNARQIHLIVMTDAGATGLDLKHAKFMFMLDVPYTPTGYFQPAGRVARVGSHADAKDKKVVVAQWVCTPPPHSELTKAAPLRFLRRVTLSSAEANFVARFSGQDHVGTDATENSEETDHSSHTSLHEARTWSIHELAWAVGTVQNGRTSYDLLKLETMCAKVRLVRAVEFQLRTGEAAPRDTINAAGDKKRLTQPLSWSPYTVS